MRGWMLPLLIILITEYLFVLVDPLIRSSQGLSSWCFLLEAACSYGGVDVFPVGYLWSDIVVSVDAGSRFFARWWIYKCMREGPCNRVCVKEIGEGMFGECLSCRLDLPSLHWTCWKKDDLLPVVPLGEQPHSPFQMLNGRVNSVKSSPTMAEGVPDIHWTPIDVTWVPSYNESMKNLSAHNQRSWKDSFLSFTSSPLQYLVIPWCGEVGGPTLVTPAISIGHAGSIRCSTTWGWRFIPLVPDTECMVGRIEPSTVEEFVLFGVVASLGTFFWLMDWWIHWFSESNWIDLIWGASYHISIYPMPAQPRWSGCL